MVASTPYGVNHAFASPERGTIVYPGRSGGTGRRAGLKIPFPFRECGFDPLLRHLQIDHLRGLAGGACGVQIRGLSFSVPASLPTAVFKSASFTVAVEDGARLVTRQHHRRFLGDVRPHEVYAWPVAEEGDRLLPVLMSFVSVAPFASSSRLLVPSTPSTSQFEGHPFTNHVGGVEFGIGVIDVNEPEPRAGAA
jgi:hypothetical protein